MKSSLQSYLKENTLHGTKGFPVGFYTTQVPLHVQNMLIHWHEEMEIGMVREGELIYDVDQARYEVRAGDILLIAPDTLHSARHLPDREASTDSVVFHLSLTGLETDDGCTRRYVAPLRDGTLRLPPVIHPGDPYYGEISACFEQLWQCRESGYPYRELRFKAQAFVLLQLLWQISAGTVMEPPARTFRQYEDKLKLALAYIQEHYAEPITIKQLADLCGFSQVHFMNIFKAAIGSTCIEYLIEYRLAHAALDLQETEHSVMQIALDNGFQNISYFNRAFKQQYLMTPTAFRRRPR